ncbi:YciI family protein [Nocardioides cheoyonin]|uniref:YciI family protein n=1 Tax=Nocardioides cheoyonin TaxID=3156615 RepID=UPI0032B39C89
MKYLMMIYANQETWSGFGPEDWVKAIAEQDAYNAKFFASGEMLGAFGLADAEQAKVVRVREGKTAVTDGPYVEMKEHLASYYLLDVESEQRALDIAAEMPFASFRGVEVWPVLHEAVPGQ